MRSYEIFLREYNGEDIVTEESELFDWLVESEKKGVHKDGYYFKTHLQEKIVSPVLKKPSNREAIIEFTGKYMDENSDALSKPGPVDMMTFSARETQFFYDMFHTNPEEMIDMYTEMEKDTYFGKISKIFTGWVKNAPHKILITAILVEACMSGYEELIECCEYLYGFIEYPMIYREFWKTGVQEDIMNYTIEHLGSKFKIKQLKNLGELLKYDATVAINFFMEQLKTGSDNVYMDLIYRIRTQMSSKFRKIANAYFANYKDAHTQHKNVTKFDDGSLADQEGHSTIAAQIIEKTISKFSSNEINQSMVRVCANALQIDQSNLSGFITQIMSTKNNRLSKLIELIIMAYFDKNSTATSISSSEFLNFGLSIYRSIGTSKDPILTEIKNILQYWINDILNLRSMYNREATIISYTRGIYNYFVLMIKYYN